MASGVSGIRVSAPPESKKEALESAQPKPLWPKVWARWGLALLRCIEAVAQEEAKCEGDEKTGVHILKTGSSKHRCGRLRKIRQSTAASWSLEC